VTVAVAAAEAATEATKQEDDEDNDEYESERHGLTLLFAAQRRAKPRIALTLRAAGPLDGKQGWVGMTIGFRMMLPLRWAGAEHSQSPVGADMRDGDGASMLFRLAESVVNIAHIGKVK